MERPSTTEDLEEPRAPRTAHEDAAVPSDGQATAHLADSRSPTQGLDGAGSAAQQRRVLDRYVLERRLGAGGFGVVWSAFDERLEREVAVKVIQREGDTTLPPRAEREARVAARLNHPGIVALYELGADDEAVYLVSELVPGRTLAQLSSASALSDRDIARIGAALCAALAHAHERKVIHRDVKPQNVIVVAEPAAGAGFAKLTDFGIAHLASGDPLTRTGDVVGTLAYMAPEQAEGVRVTGAADVYSLALTLYECWAGTNPVRGHGPVATARRLGSVLPSLESKRRELPPELCAAVDAALDPDPARRPTLGALRSALDAAVDELSDAGGLDRPGTLERVGLTDSETRERFGLAPAEPGGRLAVRLAQTPRSRLLERAGAAIAAGALAAAAAEWPTRHPPTSPVLIAAVTAAAVLLLPRLAWIVAAAAFVGWLGLGLGLHGLALVALIAAAVVPAFLPRAGTLWSLPALAPVLGLAGLAPAFLAVAGLASSYAKRAGLAAAGCAWLLLAEAASGRTLLFGVPSKTWAHVRFEHVFADAATHGLGPLVTTPALAPIAVWAVAAAVLPLFLRGRTLALDVVGASLWAAGVIAAEHAVGRLLVATGERADPRGAVIGVVAAIAIAVVAASAGLVRAPRGYADLSVVER